MASRIIVSDNYLEITDSLTLEVVFESPLGVVRYKRLPEDRILIYADGARTNFSNVHKAPVNDFIDLSDIPIPDIFNWLRTNTSVASSGISITQSATNFAALTPGSTVGDLAYVQNSQGTEWLPGTIGGTYYPAGFYLWDGAEWVSDRNAIASALDQALFEVIEDTTPKLGGDLDAKSNDINNVGNIEIEGHSYGTEFDNGNSGAADTIDFTTSNFQLSTLTGNCTFTFTAPTGPTTLILRLVQDGTGSRTVTWPGSVTWAGGTAPTLTTTASAVDIITFYYDGTNYHGSYVLDLQ